MPERPGRAGWRAHMPGRSREAALLAALLLLAAFLGLWNLGRPRLWQDEAETALLGRNVLASGLPRVWDGENLVTQSYARDFDRHLLFQKSWLPAYVAAASFAVLGESTAAARLPFALCGILTVWLTWRLARRLTGDAATALAASFLLAVSLPFVLYVRQCRWYAVAMLLSVLLVDCEERLERRAGWAWFGVALGALYHANSLVCAATTLGMLAARGLTRGWRGLFDRRFAAGLGLGAAIALPHLAAFPLFDEAVGAPDAGTMLHSVAWVAGDLNRYLLPLPGLALLLLWRGRGLLRTGWFLRLATLLAVALVASSLTIWTDLVTVIGFRYVVNLLPAAAILSAAVLKAASGSRHLALAGLCLLQVLTHLPGFPLSLWPPVGRPGIVKSDLPDAVRSVVAPVRGPIDAAVEYLDVNARRGEYLFTPYESLPLVFYTKLRITGTQKVGDILRGYGVTLPPYVSRLDPDQLDWLLHRRTWDGDLDAPTSLEILEVQRSRGREGQETILDAPDLPWQTREYPPMRILADDPRFPRTVIYHFPPRASPAAP